MLNRNKGLFGSAPPPPPAQPEQQRPSFFGHNGTGRNIAGSIGDALLQMNGMRPQFAPAHQQQQVMDYQTRQAKTEREARMQDWIAQQDYARANPAPRDPIVRENNMGDQVEIDPNTGQTRILYRDPYAPTVVGQDGIRRPLDFMPRPAEGAPERLTPEQVQALRGGGQPQAGQPPQMGAGNPSGGIEITRREYEIIANRFGRGTPALEAFMRDNNFRIGN